MQFVIQDIQAEERSLVPCLLVSTNITNQEPLVYRLFGIQAVLHFESEEGEPFEKSLLIGPGIADRIPSLGPNASDKLRVQFPMAPWILARIEERRRRDISFKILFYWQGVREEQQPKARPTYRNESVWSETYEVPQSRWTDILEVMGYWKVKLFELPVPDLRLKDPSTKVAEFLQKAQEMYLQQNFKEVLANCRQGHEELEKIL
ncbi:MAG: hypothetical protein ACXACI_19525, partial [Candidatus Hodarchaeales archaeon]